MSPNDSDVTTIAVTPCVEHPPLREWSDRNLILGCCPVCGCYEDYGTATARELRARQLIKERGL